MPKSKEFVESSDSEDAKNMDKNDSGSDDEKPKASVTKKSKTNTKEDPPAKRTKTTDGDDVPFTKGPSGERLYEFGKLRYVSVNQFKGKSYVNIREYYEDNGVQKPGKKGISLAVDQWEKLKSLINQVDKDLKKSK